MIPFSLQHCVYTVVRSPAGLAVLLQVGANKGRLAR